MINFFLTIGATALIVSMFLIYRLFVEMNNNKKAAQQPDLYPVKTNFTMTEFSFAKDRLPFVLPVRTQQKAKDKNTSPTYIELVNIGMGAAKHIEINWVYEVNKIELLIVGIYDSNKKNFINNEQFDFVFANDHIEISSPIYYLNIFGPKLKISSTSSENSPNHHLIHNPKLDLQISYKDIYNHQYFKRFNTTVETNGSKITLNFNEER